jgi:hypothetical protein
MRDCLLRGSLRPSRRFLKEPLRLQNSSRMRAEQLVPESEFPRKPFKEPTNPKKGPLSVTRAKKTQSLKPYALLCRPSRDKNFVSSSTKMERRWYSRSVGNTNAQRNEQTKTHILKPPWVIKRNATITKYGIGLLAPERPRWFHKNVHIQKSPTKC